MAIYLSRKKGVTPTSITPSNSSPAALTANTAVTPTANGYAIESYDSVTPSSAPTSVSSGDIVKIGGSGVIVDIIPTPPSLTPSNATPATITSGNSYTATGNGYAISSYDSVTPSSTAHNVASGDIIKIGGTGIIISNIPTITPSNNNPVPLSAGNPVRPTISGYAIEGYSSRTPSDSSPASVLGGAIIKASASGYLYSSSGLGKCKAGTFTSSTSSQTINLGFQPKYLLVMTDGRTSNIYDVSYSSTQAVYAATNAYSTNYTISGNSSNNHISAISSTGFTYNKSGSAGSTIYYFAVG